MCVTASAQVTETGDLYDHVDSIITVLPTEEAEFQDDYEEPDVSERSQWRTIIQEMLEGDYATAHSLAGALNYRVVEFTDNSTVPNQTYFILERTPSSTDNHWGTFVFNPAPARSRLVIQAPHPLQNVNTGNQGIRVFKMADCWIYCVAGTHKCNSTAYSSCDGTSTSCDETPEPYRLCDQAHAVTATFQLTTEEILSVKPQAVVIQPHGYTKGSGGPDDPDIIMSNGTTNTPPTSYLVELRANLQAIDNVLTYKIAHIDTDYTYFLGRENVQGRLVNGMADPCDDPPTQNTGNFIHLEQAYSRLRDNEANWSKLANAVAMTFSPDVQITSAQSGPWLDVNTWVGGVVPTRDDDVLIDAGHTISIDDTTCECLSMTFGDTASHIDMNADSRLSVYGDFTLFAEDHNVFSAGWSATNAFIRFTGSASTQTLSGWSTTGGSTSFRDVIIDKPIGTMVTTGGTNMRFAIQNSLEIISGTFLLALDDDFEARFASSGNLTGNQDLTILVQADGEFRMANGTGVHWIRSETGSTPIGKMTVYGYAEFTDASSSDISLDGIDVMDGGTVELGLGLTSSGPAFNPDTITVFSGGEIYSITTSDIWFATAVVLLNDGATYKTTGSTTVFPPTFVNEGKVRYQRDPTTASDQVVVDTDYWDIEFSFNGGAHLKQWALTGDRFITDSFTVNNSADVVLTAPAAQTLTVGQTLRLTSGTIDNSDANATIEMADGSSISRATGTISNAPSFAGVVDLRYTSSTSSVTTGPEMPATASALRDLTIFSSGQTVMLDDDIVVNGALTLSSGTFDNDGVDNDYTMTMADGSSIRRATADLTAVPGFAGMVDMEYISTVGHVTTGPEMPTAANVINNLSILGTQGVTLGSDITVNGTLTVDGSDLYTDAFEITLPDGASIVENNGYTVKGTATATRTMSQSVNESFGGLGIDLNASGAAPGVATAVRVTNDPQDISGVLGISRYFDITAATNTGLAATMVFHYEDVELNGIQEDSLALYSSTNGGASWTYRGGVVDALNNTVTLSGIGGFSRWTLGGVALEGQAISAQSGSWTDPATWVGSNVPDTSDDVLILSGHTVSVDDTLAVGKSLAFTGDDALIDMNADSRLTLYGDMALFSETHNVFSAGWSSADAYVRFAGGATQTLSGWSTTGASTSFRDLIIEKDSGTVVTTGATGMKLCVQNSLQIISGILELAPDDDFEGRWASSGNFLNDTLPAVTIQPMGVFRLVDGDGTHLIRSNTGSVPVGRFTIHGLAEFTDASSSDISLGNIDVRAGGQLTLGLGLGSTTYGPEFNPGTIIVDSGGTIFSETTSELWFDTSVVILNRGGIYKTTSSTTPFPPTFINDGRVRYQRNPSTATTDQIVVDTNYWDIEFSFAGNGTRKLWELLGDRVIADSLEVNNTAEVIITAGGAHTLTVDSTLRLTSGSLDVSDADLTLIMADGSSISRATGTISSAPTFAGVVDVRYTSSVESVPTGPELPLSPTTLRDLTIFSSDQTVTLSEDATVNGELTLSIGTFDNNGSSDDKVLSMADGSTLRRATGELTAAPTFGTTVDVEYISTVGAVVTGVELPVSATVLNDLRILGNQGVTLGASVTVNGELHLADSILSTDAFAVTLGSSATIVEDSIWAVQGTVQTTRTLAQGVNGAFGGLGIEINAANAAPGSTPVVRVVGQSQTVGGNPSILRRYQIAPAVNNGLGATVVFHYKDRELNGLTETQLQVYRSTDGGSNWQGLGGVVDTLANTVTVTGVNQLGWLTLGGPSSGCCVGLRGDLDGEGDPSIPTLGDLTVMIDHLFITLSPLDCWEEGNLDGSLPEGPGSVTLGDLTIIIDNLFISLTPTPPCP